MKLQLEIVGYILIVLAMMHTIFPKYFNWEIELSALNLVNKQMMYVHAFFVALTIFLMGVFCISCSDDIINTTLGHKIAFGLFLFWAIRLLFQLFVYSPKLWKGKALETTVHIIFSLLWGYLGVIFLIISMK